MQTQPDQNTHFFEIAREPASISFDEFSQKYLTPEIPVIIQGVGTEWPARNKWNESYLREQLSQEPSASAASLWYWMNRGVLSNDYTTPDIVNKCLDSQSTFPRTQHNRIWVNNKGDMSNWHYDGGLVNVFNIQIKGQKEWFLISPDTPVDCYPFTNFCIIDGKEDEILKDKTHTHFFLNEGDMVYIPPVWFHKVISCDETNINLNWLFTKKETSATSVTLKREVERYIIDNYFSKHRFKIMRSISQQFNKRAPGYLKINWRYKELIKTSFHISRIDLCKRIGKEITLFGKTLLHASKIKPYTKTLSTPKKLSKSPH